MATKFKVGDRIRMVNPETSNDVPIGTLGTITNADDQDRFPYIVEWDKGNKGYAAVCDKEIELASGKQNMAKVLPVKFLLQYDQTQCETFTSEAQLRTRINELARAKASGRTFTVHDIKRTRTVEIGVKITIK